MGTKTDTISLPDPHPIYKCNNHLRAEYVMASLKGTKYKERMAELEREMDVRQLTGRAFVMNSVEDEGKKEFVELMQTCKACRQQAILYGNYKAKNLPPLKEGL